MEKKRIVLGVVMVVLCLGCIIGNINVLIQSYEFDMPKILAAVAILACVSAAYYALRGFKKYTAPAYTVFMFICSVFNMLCIIGTAIRIGGTEHEIITAFIVVMNTVLFSCFQLLAIPKDFGKARSFGAAYVILGIVAAQLIWAIIGAVSGSGFGFANNLAIFVRMGTKIVMVVVTLIMVYAKYSDKEERGSK